MLSKSVISEYNLNQFYSKQTKVILFAHGLTGTVRGKSANGLIIHTSLFNVVGIVDSNATEKKTSEICQGVSVDIPIYSSINQAIEKCDFAVLVLLIAPEKKYAEELYNAVENGFDLINASFTFLKNIKDLKQRADNRKVRLLDLRDVSHLKAYPNPLITQRNAKVVYVTGTDCGLGKRTATYELTKAALELGLKAKMFATGQTGLMLGEEGVVIDATTIEFSNGIASQYIMEIEAQDYDLIFVEGQSDIFHPANSAVALSILHGTNPDCIVLVHDEMRKVHKGFDEEADLYQMHPFQKYIDTLEMLSLPCGPTYKTVGIATIGNENIRTIKSMLSSKIAVADVLAQNGAKVLFNAISKYLEL